MAQANPQRSPWAKRSLLVIWDALGHMMRNEGMAIAGYLAYLSLLSLFPCFICIISAAGFFGQTELGADFVNIILEAVPAEVAGVLEAPIRQVIDRPGQGILTVSALMAVWVASSGVEGARIAVNRALNLREVHPFWRTRLESMALIVISPGLIIAVMGFLVVVPLIWQEIQAFFDIPFGLGAYWKPIRNIIMVYLTLQTVAGLFYVLPAVRQRFRTILPGAVLVTAAWILTGELFSQIIGRFGQHALVYAGLANIIVTLLFFYILAVAFVFGAELNAAVIRRAKAQAVAENQLPAD
jgi:membrane protein